MSRFALGIVSAETPGVTMVAGVDVENNGVGWAEGAFGTITGQPTDDVTWTTIATFEIIGGLLVVQLSGNQLGYFAGKSLSIGSDAYSGASMLGEVYEGLSSGQTAFYWAPITPLVDGVSYNIRIE